MTRAFTGSEMERIGWVAPIGRRYGDDKHCHLCRHYCFRDAEKTKIGNSGSFGHLVMCCRALENTAGPVRTTQAFATCNNWGRRQ